MTSQRLLDTLHVDFGSFNQCVVGSTISYLSIYLSIHLCRKP